MFPDERFTTTRFAQFGQTAYGPPHARGTIVHRLGRSRHAAFSSTRAHRSVSV